MVVWKKFEGTREQWNQDLFKLDNYNLYQSFEWGEIKKETGWNIFRAILIQKENITTMVQVLYRNYPMGICLCWIPGGFVGDLNHIDLQFLKKEIGAKFIIARSSFTYESQHNIKQSN